MRRQQCMAQVVVFIVVAVCVAAAPVQTQGCPELVGQLPGQISGVAVSGTDSQAFVADAFLEVHRDELVRVRKPVKLEHVGALVAQAKDTILFENISRYPGFRLVDQLFVNRKAQARVLGCEPKGVVKRLAEVIRKGPRPLKEVKSAPCQERVFTGNEVDLSMLPVVRHTQLDPYPYATGFAVHRDPATGAFNAMFPRSGVLNRNEMVTSYVTPTAGKFLAGHKATGKKMPQAMVIGAHPAWELAA